MDNGNLVLANIPLDSFPSLMWDDIEAKNVHNTYSLVSLANPNHKGAGPS
jgi:hypothetical protein